MNDGLGEPGVRDERERLLSDWRMRVLAAWCGIWELGHFLLTVNTYFFGAREFPPPPPGGWTDQTWHIFLGMVASDMLQAALCVGFAAAFLAKRRWSFVLGVVCLGGSSFSSLAFTIFTVSTGAWAEHPSDYWIVQLLWAPLFLLFIALCRGLIVERTMSASALRLPANEALQP